MEILLYKVTKKKKNEILDNSVMFAFDGDAICLKVKDINTII